MNDFEFKKSLGQNFLKDKNKVREIVDSINYDKKSLVIEIGPGCGYLSCEILKKVSFAILYEIDTRLESILKDNLCEFDNYDIIFGDFLVRDVNNDLKKYEYDNLYIVANLPYYITTPIISKIIKDDIPAKEITIMIQKEVAERILSLPGNKSYGELTVFLNYFYDIKKVCEVSRNSFIPKPNVDSTVIKMIRKDEKEFLKDLNQFTLLVKNAFRYKRKTIKNNLSMYNLEIVSSILNKYGFDLSSRSEILPYNVFVDLSNNLVNLKNNE